MWQNTLELNRITSISLLLFLALSFCSVSVPMHEFYVSLAEIRYNTESEALEVSLRIFPDDMDRALETHYGIISNLATEIEHPLADSLLEIYLNELFKIELDGKSTPLSYLGKEAESDVMWCYMESGPVALPCEIIVNNSILTEIYEDQVNITQVYVGKWNRGLLLRREHPRGHLIIGD